MRTRWTPPPTPPPAELPPRPLHQLLGVAVWTDGKGEYVLTGTPEPGEEHSCDLMGCPSAGPHVLRRLRERPCT